MEDFYNFLQCNTYIERLQSPSEVLALLSEHAKVKHVMHKEVDKLREADEAAARLAHTIDTLKHDVVHSLELHYNILRNTLGLLCNYRLQHVAQLE